MKREMIQDRLARANTADYTNARDVQNFIQEKVNQEAFLEWCRTEQPRQPMSIAGLPSRMYEPVKVEPFYRRYLSQLLP